MTSRTRTVLLGLLVVVVVIGCASAGIFTLVVGGLPGSQDKQLTARADAARTAIATAPAGAFVTAPPIAPIDPATDNDIFTVVLAADGTPITWTGGRDPRLPASVLAAARTKAVAATVDIDGVPVRVCVEPWSRPDLGRSGFVVAAQPIRRRTSDLAGLAAVLIIAAVVTLIAAAAGIWWVSRRLQRAHRRTADALAGQQRFAADASHELRTPLTTILNNASFLRAHPEAATHDRDAAVADIEAEASRMGRLVGDLLTLARADGGAAPVPADVDVGALTVAAARRYAAQHPDRHIHCAEAPPMVMRADGDQWTQLLSILLDNAVRHTAPGGNVWVSMIARGPYHVVLQVADDGDGIPDGEHERIFDRFHQSDPARKRGGAGLGLSIARWIVTAHRGSITAAGNALGGATFTVEISSLS